jgi:hypothetical protein
MMKAGGYAFLASACRSFAVVWKLGATDPYNFTDSGGPGTYSQLLILKEYMSRLANDLGCNEDEIYPADHFDMMGGVGFGGSALHLKPHSHSHVST